MQIGSVQAKTTSLIVQPAKTTSRGYYDPADTNKDGLVSGAEALAYALTHPQLGAQRTTNAASTHPSQGSAVHSANPYSQNTTVTRRTSAQHGLLDLKA